MLHPAIPVELKELMRKFFSQRLLRASAGTDDKKSSVNFHRQRADFEPLTDEINRCWWVNDTHAEPPRNEGASGMGQARFQVGDSGNLSESDLYA